MPLIIRHTMIIPRRQVWGNNDLLAQGIEAIIVSERDYLNAGGTLYKVKWNKD